MTLDNHLSYRNYNKRKTLSPFLKGFVWGGIFTLTATISGIIGATIALKSSLPVNITPILEQIETFKENGLSGFFLPHLKQPINILVMGIDKVPNALPGSPDAFAGRSDTMLLVRFEPKDNSLRILSIPRDSRVEMPNGGYDKVNGANARGGADFAMEVLNHNFNGVKIDRYVRVTTDVFKELVDLVGGVEVYVPTDMQYTDVTQKLKIDLKQGLQTLNGEQAEQFARFRKDNLGDIGRVQRQQILLKALQTKVKNPLIITRIPQIKDLLENSINTNLSYQEMLSLFGFARHLNKDNIKMIMLPGRFSTPNEYSLSYWLISDRGKNKVMNEYFNVESSADDNLRYIWRSPNQIKIAIQNGTSNKDIGIAVVKYLEDHDFKNVYISNNFAPPTPKTQIVAQQGDLHAAEMLQRILEFGEIDISSTGDLDSDLTIQVGEDAQKLIINN